MPATEQPRDAALRERARRVVPGGMTGHLHAAMLPPGYPQFFASGSGCRLVDVDGREFVDFMCAWGPNLLGYRHPGVEAAAARQQALGDCLNGPGERFVELAERLVDQVAHADWAMFQKNGTDATTVALTIARAATGRRKVLVARRAYHGAAPWCTPAPAGVTAEDRAHLVNVTYNDVGSVEAACDEVGADLAAIIVTPHRHELGTEQQPVDPAFARRLRELCDRAGAALVLDEVRTGLRIDPAGSWESLGIRPDLAAWSKTIANGHALAAVTGTDALRDAATRIFTTGSFWCGAVAMAAGVATLDIVAREDVVGHLGRIGGLLREGLAAQSVSHGVPVRQSGPVQMPLVLFEDDADFAKGTLFCAEALARGAYLHPRHNMFLSLAHTEADIDRALVATDAAFAAVAARFSHT
jgi:glutamate-1-semialdehyde 2,1-aminomutase